GQHPQHPRRRGRPAASISRRRDGPVDRPHRLRGIHHRGHRETLAEDDGRGPRPRRTRQGKSVSDRRARRHTRGSQLLPPWRHPALRFAANALDECSSPTLLWPASLKAARTTGQSLMDTLRAMTINTARLLGVDGKRGTIKPGLAADIIATPENSLDNIQAVRKVSFVMKD